MTAPLNLKPNPDSGAAPQTSEEQKEWTLATILHRPLTEIVDMHSVTAAFFVIDEAYVQLAVDQALGQHSNLEPAVLEIALGATPMMRHLFNNLMRGPGIRYLEVGLFRGSSFCAGLSNNEVGHAVGIDNFSENFGTSGDVRQELLSNIARFKGNSRVEFIDGHAFGDAVKSIPDDYFDIYYYDGCHDYESQALALPHFLPTLRRDFLFVVDDMTREAVRRGTEDGFKALEKSVEVLAEWEMRGPVAEWGNGMNLYLCRRYEKGSHGGGSPDRVNPEPASCSIQARTSDTMPSALVNPPDQ